MTDMKKLKSIDLSSITIIGTSINFIWAIIIAIIFLASMSIFGGFNPSLIMIALGIIFGVLVISIPKYFGISCLYNYFITKLRDVEFEIIEMKKVTKISIVPFSFIAAVIALILAIIVYPIIVIGTPAIVIQLIQLLISQASTQAIGFILYQLLLTIYNPLMIVYVVLGAFVFTLVGSAVFNVVIPRIGGLKVDLSSNGEMTTINSFTPLNAGIIAGIMSLIFGLITGLIISVLSGSLPAALSLIAILVVGGFIIGLIWGAVSSALYNFFAKKTGGIKVKLPEA
ncbi:hypothetical protein MBCUT_19060 [Methanobrevibacter cuticularis]|uniref:DUF4013 domain-containing protein n=1 Tax=Methanobrevibacter cuticularis TaxID=47311 RepID=A0A166CR21_9EURY|nr:hypothetical protein [Methanobrevibacter cuticularis]KZX14778.1 hypothetical protein MBCUT_19060 [Methanobrevibacter cuticularis]